MAQAGSTINTSNNKPTKLAAWGTAIGSTFGILFAVVVVMNVIALAVLHLPHLYPPAQTHTPQGIVVYFATSSILGEAAAVIVLWRLLRAKQDSLGRLGLWRKAPWTGWLAGLAVAAYSVIPAVNGLHNGIQHLSITNILFNSSPVHIYTALTLGIGAGICEEVFFRGYIMTRLADSGYGNIVQVIASGVFFGFAHGLYGLSNGAAAGLDIMLHTALLGCLYAIVYLISRRSLMPCIFSHFLNDAIVLPWIFLQMFHTH